MSFYPHSKHNISEKERLELFTRISSRMRDTADEDTFFTTTLADIGHVMQVSRSYIFEIDNGLWSNTYEWVEDGVSSGKDSLQKMNLSYLEGEGRMLHVLFCGKAYVIEDVDAVEDISFRKLLQAQKIKALIIVPIFTAGEIEGFFGLDLCKHVPGWTEDTISTVIILGSLISNARAYYTTQRVLQKKQMQAQALFDAFPFPIYVSNMQDYSIIFYNKNIADLFDSASVLGTKCYEAFQGLKAPCPFCTNASLELGDPPYVWHHHNAVAQKDYKVLDRCMSWERNPKVRLSIALDISDSLRLQREQVLEREANLAKGRFLANMSHELRTPLNGIIGMTHLAHTANEDENIKDYLNKVQLSSRNLLAIINDILDFSKIENESVQLEYRPFNFGEILFETQAILQTEVSRKNIYLQCVVDENVHATLLGDSLRLSQILLNLTNNAIKFTKKGGVTIEVRVKEDQETQQILQLLVKDTGIGISERNLQKLFTEFTQAEASTTRNYGGTGLGLTIVQRLIGLMQGSISVESTLSEGTTFICTIPFSKAVGVESVQKKEEIIESAEEDIAGTKILLVEDNEINVLIATEVLEQYGCEVDCAGDGLIALKMLEKKEYDLVLMDIQMPNLDGIETVERIRSMEKYNTLPVVAMSAHALVQDREKSLAAGMQDHIIKPFVPQDLRKVIYSYVHAPFVFQGK